ncbi:MarR family transcriptional regulator [Corynebacterium sp. sy017]|uniref:MarR family winged helix-turn-helix transcriptional regulator n=1 Tax=unclassified Corynebacterium TaxID=2624378 RepID=UPI0011866AA9|nr:MULTISPECIES: winged helix DNA-binding protein [unclassified Corynebacterium]MBP3088387.1 MarR family transcriptional regulator [Corynebacterium sp. sy017]TSD91702.1 MarR family transcriptional regulator [Corynebacterium sp. SY003]
MKQQTQESQESLPTVNSTESLAKHPEEFRYLILALQRQGNRQLNKVFSELGLTNSQAEAIEVVGSQGPLTTKEVGQYLICESGSPSRLLSTLAKKGLTVTSHPSNDKRATLHALSPKGREILSEIQAQRTAFENQLQGTLTTAIKEYPENTLKQLVSLLTDPELTSAMSRRFPHLFL